MRKWINKNIKTIIITAFLIPIFIVGIVSITHVTTWYQTSNPNSWALYLSIGVEIAALSALAAISVKMGKHAYLPFIIVTLIQFIGNIFYSFYFIDVSGALFTSWIELVGPVFQIIGVEATNIAAHKGILSLLTGGLLPIISLTFLYSLVRFVDKTENETTNPIEESVKNEDDVVNEQSPVIPSSDLISEISKIRPSDEDVEKLQAYLNHFKPKTKEEVIKEEIPLDDSIIEEKNNFSPLGYEELEEIRKVLANIRINESNKIEETSVVEQELVTEEKKTEIIDENEVAETIDNQEIEPHSNTDEQTIENVISEESVPEPIIDEIPYENNIEPVISENVPEEISDNDQKDEEQEIVDVPVEENEESNQINDIGLVTEFPSLELESDNDIGLETEFPSLEPDPVDDVGNEPEQSEQEIDTTYIEENVESTDEQPDDETKKKV